MSKIYHLEGQKFGKLTVVEKTVNPNSKGKKTFWKCVCDCGNESIVCSSDLINSKIQQCWECAHYASNIHKRKDYTGQRFGKLVVLNMIYPDRQHKQLDTQAECVCDCGNIVTRSMEKIIKSKRDGYIPSCGCRRKEIAEEQSIDVIGKHYGRLTPIEYTSIIKPVKIRCICDCGKETIITKHDLLAGSTQSCGCLRLDRISESNTVDYTDQVTDTAIKFIRQVEKNRTGQWLWLCECQICGEKFVGCPSIMKSKGRVGCGRHKTSSRECLIEDFLKRHNVDYKPEYRFQDCRDQYTLPFDFALLHDDDNVRYLIEYDGKQHYEPIDYFGGEKSFQLLQYHDQIKNDYCKKNNIPLLRLPYYLSDDEIKEKISNII